MSTRIEKVPLDTRQMFEWFKTNMIVNSPTVYNRSVCVNILCFWSTILPISDKYWLRLDVNINSEPRGFACRDRDRWPERSDRWRKSASAQDYRNFPSRWKWSRLSESLRVFASLAARRKRARECDDNKTSHRNKVQFLTHLHLWFVAKTFLINEIYFGKKHEIMWRSTSSSFTVMLTLRSKRFLYT